MSKPIRLTLFFLFSLVLVVADLVSKWAAIAFLKGKPPLVLLPVLDFRYIENRDIAFSLLEWLPDSIRPTLIIVLASAMTVYVLFLFFQYATDFPILGFGLSMILAGAIGNLIDRFARGFVVDFIHCFYGTYSWPVFNIADICVTTGVGLIAIGIFVIPSEPESSAPEAQSSQEGAEASEGQGSHEVAEVLEDQESSEAKKQEDPS